MLHVALFLGASNNYTLFELKRESIMACFKQISHLLVERLGSSYMDQKRFSPAPYTVHCIMHLVGSLNSGKRK